MTILNYTDVAEQLNSNYDYDYDYDYAFAFDVTKTISVEGLYNFAEEDDDFDSGKFWDWVRVKVSQGHDVFISEYKAPSDFVCVWVKRLKAH